MSAGHFDLGSNITATEDLQGGGPTTSMKKGWLYRTSCDEKNHEIAHMMMTNSDDPDLVMMTSRDPD